MLVQSKLASGAFVIAVSLFNTACTTTVPGRQPMPHHSLDRYQIDCSKKAQQIAFLQSLRPTRTEQIAAGTANLTAPWMIVTDRQTYQYRVDMHNGKTDWTINQLLMRLAHDC